MSAIDSIPADVMDMINGVPAPPQPPPPSTVGGPNGGVVDIDGLIDQWNGVVGGQTTQTGPVEPDDIGNVIDQLNSTGAPQAKPPASDADVAAGLTRTFGDGRVDDDFVQIARDPAIAGLSAEKRDEVLMSTAQVLGIVDGALRATAALDGKGVLADGVIDAGELADIRKVLEAPIDGAKDGPTYAEAIQALEKKIGGALGEESIPQTLKDIFDLVSVKPDAGAPAAGTKSNADASPGVTVETLPEIKRPEAAQPAEPGAKPVDNLNTVLNQMREMRADGKISQDEFQRLVGSDAFQGLPAWVQKIVSDLAGFDAPPSASSTSAGGGDAGAPKPDTTTGSVGQVPTAGEASQSGNDGGSARFAAGPGTVASASAADAPAINGPLTTAEVMNFTVNVLSMMTDGKISSTELETLKNSPEFQKFPPEIQTELLGPNNALRDLGLALMYSAMKTGVFDDQDFSAGDASRLITDAIKGIESGDIPIGRAPFVVDLLKTLMGNEQPSQPVIPVTTPPMAAGQAA